LHELLAKLSQFPSFKWVDPKKAEGNEKFTWKNLKDILPDQEMQPSDIRKQLKEWFQDLSIQLEKKSLG
jgi:hypothetical protein